jgi:betaine lipid synthase
MASLIPNILPKDPHTQIFIVGASLVLLIGIIFASTLKTNKNDEADPSAWSSFVRFFYACFLKPHEGDGGTGQQAALESFYKAQADVYDATRKTLLRGREDMLALVAAQLVQKAARERGHDPKRIWVDVSMKISTTISFTNSFCEQVGGGTGYNIEAMSAYVSVPDFFSSVYLVDFSPSLCEVARKRFARLGWDNVKVVCQDARLFRLEDHENVTGDTVGFPASPTSHYFPNDRPSVGGADLITMSYSLSMIVSSLQRVLIQANYSSPISTRSSTL